MTDFEKKLEKYYNKFNEDHRLTTRHGTVEFITSMKYIHEAISAKNNPKILDIGAGTGRYSLALAKEGFDVTAVELVKKNIDFIRQKHKNVKTWQGNATDLNFLPDSTYDICIAFGPFYHLQSKTEKLKAFSEIKRVAKKDAIIFVAYIMNEYAILTYCFKENNIADCLKNKTITSDFHTITTENDLYSYSRLEDIDELNQNTGLRRIKIFAQDGAADYMRKELNAMDDFTFEKFIEYHLATCERKDLLGASSHIVDVLSL